MARFVPAIVSAVVAVVLWPLVGGTRALVALGLAAVLAALIALGVDVAGPMARFTDAVVSGLTSALSWLLGMVLFVPAWALLRLLRVDPLDARRRGGWAVPGADPAASSLYRVEPTVRRRWSRSRPVELRAGTPPPRRRPALLTAVGVVCVVMVVDVTAGVVWNSIVGVAADTAPLGAIRMGPGEFDNGGAPDVAGDPPPDPRQDGPAMSGAPWSEQYFRELNSFGSSYWPFTQYRPRDFRGRYLNVTDWERASLRSGSAPVTPPVVAFFGGSATFGEGQRDEHTIASEIVRLAEAEGTPVVARNFGQRGWVIWQEMTLYEQLLASGERFDLSVFYDGPNDLTVQSEPVSGVPTHYDVEEYARRLAVSSDPSANRTETGLGSAVVAWWQRRSILYRGVNWFIPDAGAVPDSTRSVGAGSPEEWARHGVDVYRRGRALVQALSDQYGVDARYFWQPQREDLPAYRWAAENVGAPTVDLSDVLAGREDVFLDMVHTNEEGARLVAAAMWQELRPWVAEWYEQGEGSASGPG